MEPVPGQVVTGIRRFSPLGLKFARNAPAGNYPFLCIYREQGTANALHVNCRFQGNLAFEHQSRCSIHTREELSADARSFHGYGDRARSVVTFNL